MAHSSSKYKPKHSGAPTIHLSLNLSEERPCGLQGLSSPTRDQTCTSWSGSVESYPLEHQGGPHLSLNVSPYFLLHPPNPRCVSILPLKPSSFPKQGVRFFPCLALLTWLLWILRGWAAFPLLPWNVSLLPWFQPTVTSSTLKSSVHVPYDSISPFSWNVSLVLYKNGFQVQTNREFSANKRSAHYTSARPPGFIC